MEYQKLPSAASGLYSHGQNRNTSSSAIPNRPPSKSQTATWRSVRFSARVPGTGQRGSLYTVSTPSIRPPRATSSSRDIAFNSASLGSVDAPTRSDVSVVLTPSLTLSLIRRAPPHRFGLHSRQPGSLAPLLLIASLCIV